MRAVPVKEKIASVPVSALAVPDPHPGNKIKKKDKCNRKCQHQGDVSDNMSKP